MMKFMVSLYIICIFHLFWKIDANRKKQIISHRGASGYIPEHSIASYRLAIDLGTDYIEPDLCLTKDGVNLVHIKTTLIILLILVLHSFIPLGVFVAMHDLLLDMTTDVKRKKYFVGRNSTKMVNGKEMNGYFVSDFTYSELQKLTLKQRLSGRSTSLNDFLLIPRLEDIIQLVQGYRKSNEKIIGLYIETKVVPIVIQNFESTSLRIFSKKSDLPLVQLIDFSSPTTTSLILASSLSSSSSSSSAAPMIISHLEPLANTTITSQDIEIDIEYSETMVIGQEKENKEVTKGGWEGLIENLMELSTYASGLGPNKDSLLHLPWKQTAQLVDQLHSLHLVIHPWTFRADNGISPQFFNDTEIEQYFFLYCLGVDGLFTEFPDVTRLVIRQNSTGGGDFNCDDLDKISK